MGLFNCCYSNDEYSDINGEKIYKLTKYAHSIIGGNSKIYRIKINQKLIVKRFNKSNKKMALNEYVILKALNESICHQFFPILIKNEFYLGHYYLVMKDEKFYDLFSLYKRNIRLNVPTIINMFNQMLNGILELNKLGISHLDIKPENIIIKKISKKEAIAHNIQWDLNYVRKTMGIEYDGNDILYRVKIIDLAGSKNQSELKKVKNGKYDNFISTYGYTAPEYYLNSEINNKFDVWSLGIILWELLLGYTPFDSYTIDYINEITNFDLFNPFIVYRTDIRKLNPMFVSILKKMIEPNKDKRISIEDLFNYKVFYKILKN